MSGIVLLAILNSRWFAATRVGAWLFVRVLHRVDRLAFRLSRGRRTVTSVLSGLPVVMLTTTGARSGLARTVPVLGFPIDEMHEVQFAQSRAELERMVEQFAKR